MREISVCLLNVGYARLKSIHESTVAKVTGEILARGDVLVNFKVVGGTNCLFGMSVSKFVLIDSFMDKDVDKREVQHLRRGKKRRRMC